MLSGDIPPNQTIYIRNLNEKVKKEELKRALYALFSQFGRILDVVALKTPKLRGQAWLVFAEITSSSNAFRQMQNFPFYDKPMRIQYAKTKSDCVAKADGTFAPGDKKKKQEEKVADKKRKADETRVNNPPSAESNGASRQAGTPPNPPSNPPSDSSSSSSSLPPNNVLFLQNLPEETNGMMLEILFKQFPGFAEVRVVPARPGIAFVEFEDENQAAVAMQSLQGFKVTPQFPMGISFAKK